MNEEELEKKVNIAIDQRATPIANGPGQVDKEDLEPFLTNLFKNTIKISSARLLKLGNKISLVFPSSFCFQLYLRLGLRKDINIEPIP